MDVIPDQAIEAALATLLGHAIPLRGGNDMYLTTEDPAVLGEQLDKKAASLERVLATFSNNVQQRIASIRRRRNQLLCIYRLPAEILSIIFLEVLRGSDASQRVHCTEKIERVSFHWRSVAHETSQLWTFLDNRASIARTTAAIRRSKQAPLHVSCAIDNTLQSPQNEERFLNIVVSQIERWESFTSTSSFTVSFICKYFKGRSAPVLRRFSLITDGMGLIGDLVLPNFWPSNTRSLRELLVFPYSCPLDPKMLSGLTHFSFSPYFLGDPFTEAQWHLALSSAPKLQVLSIQGQPSRPYRLDLRLDFDFRLPDLRDMYLKVLDAPIVGNILSSLLLETNQRLNVVVGPLSLDAAYDTRLLPASPPLHSVLGTVRSSARSIVGRCTYDGQRMDVSLDVGLVRGNRFTLGCRLRSSPVSLLMTLFTPSGRSVLTKLALHGVGWSEGGGICWQLHSFTGLTSLEISVKYDDIVTEVCDTLSKPISPIGMNSTSWVCPRLIHLTIKGGWYMRPIAMLMEARYGSAAVGACGSVLPAQLERIHIGGFSEQAEEVKQLRDILSPYGTQLVVDE